MFDYPRGAEWRKWDLHIHSNASDGKAAPEDIIDEAVKKGLAVIAITDHHTFANVDKTKQLGKAAGITVISGIELRTEYGQKSVHIIGLFPDNYSGTILSQDALSDFILGKLGITRTEIISKGRDGNQSINEEEAFKRGIFRVQVDFKEAANLIHQYGGIVTVHAGNKSNSIEEMKHNGNGTTNVDLLEDSLGTVKEELLREYIDICEIQKQSEALFYLNNFSRPSIAASDAHDKSSIGKKFTWIKADPSFAGLQQIKYEPEQRVRIQETMPDQKPSYAVIDRVEIRNSSFSPADSSIIIPFNPDLNCIIGGKSTGKSLLLNNIAYAVDKDQVVKKLGITQPESKKKKETDAFSPISDIIVHWKDESETPNQANKRKIVYIPQTYLNRLSDEKEETTEVDKIIEEILLQDESIKEKRYELDALKVQIKRETDGLLSEYLMLCNKIIENKKALLESNNSVVVEKEIQKLEEEQKKYISDDTAITEDQLLKYNELQEKLQKTTQHKTDLNKDKASIERVDVIEIKNPFTLVDFQAETKDRIATILESIQHELNKYWQNSKKQLVKEFDEKISNCGVGIEQISKELEILQPLVEKNEAFLMLSEKISQQKKKLVEAKKVENNIQNQSEKAKELLSSIIACFFKYKEAYDTFISFVNETKSEKVEGLNFYAETVFRSDAFCQMLANALNQKTVSRFKKTDILKINEDSLSAEVLEAFVNSLISQNTDSIELKTQQNIAVFLGEAFGDWYNVNYIVKMDADNFEKMSPGKKALVLLKLLIGLANSESPMLIDQPEDDLDNRSIYDDLVKYIKEKKQERQIIIVTHNANIVVGADSDEVIVANKDGENTPNKSYSFEYVSGSIENSWENEQEKAVLYSQGIKEHICEILEGGVLAFEKRADKYNIKVTL